MHFPEMFYCTKLPTVFLIVATKLKSKNNVTCRYRTNNSQTIKNLIF